MQSEDGRVDRILRHSRAVGHEARGLRNELGEAAREIKARLDVTDAIREHPFRSLAFGLAAGYVLGGGLCARSTRALFAWGVRAAILPVVKSQAMALLAPDERRTEGGML